MTDLVDALERAWADGAEHVTSLTADQLAQPTACADWNVKDLLNHTLGESLMFSEVNRREPASNDHGDVVGDGSALAATWHRVAQDNVRSWREGGLDGERTYFFGTFPAPASVIVNLGEVLVHTWDLATAVGRPVVLEPELVDLVLGLYENVPMDDLRAHGVYGAEVTVPDDAPAADRLIAFLGRQP